MSFYQLLVTHTWWQYKPNSPLHQAYHWFNLLEGTIWVALSMLVATRFARCRRGWLEVPYAIAFFTFGMSDFREAYHLESWLLLFKGANLVALLLLRREVIRRWYPASKLY